VALSFQNYQSVAFILIPLKSKTINLWLYDYQFVAFDYQSVAFSKLWITLAHLVFTGFAAHITIMKNAPKYLK